MSRPIPSPTRAWSTHRALVYVEDDFPEVWGWYCLRCPDARKGYQTRDAATRSARKHDAPVLQETNA